MAGRISLGQRPADLPRILALVALGGPATIAVRALSRVSGGGKSFDRLALRNEAAFVGWAFRSLFNLPEVTAMIDASRDEIERVEWRSEEVSNEEGWLVSQRFDDTALSLDAAVDLLNEYTARTSASDPSGVARRYRDLLDALSSCRAGGVKGL